MLLGLQSTYLDPSGLKQDSLWKVFDNVQEAESWQNEPLPLPPGAYQIYRRYKEAVLPDVDVYSIAQSLARGDTPESLGLRFGRVSAAGFGAFWYGQIWFTQHESKGGWTWGYVSDNGVSAYPRGRIYKDGTVKRAVATWNPYVKRDTTHWSGPWKLMSEEDILHARYSRAFYS